MSEYSNTKSYFFEIKHLIIRIVILLFSLLILFSVVIGIAAVPDLSMEPVLSAGDIVIFFRLDKELKSGDIVVYSDDGIMRTGRVVAVGGDTVKIMDDGTLYINDNRIIESDIYYDITPIDSDVEYPVCLEEDEVFILCDRRGAQVDSRSLGAVKTGDVKGKLFAAIRKQGF